MKLKAARADLARELGLAQGVVEKKNTIPILSNVRLEAADGRLSLSSTDLEIGLVHSLPAKVSKPGVHTVSAKKLYEIVRALEADEVGIELQDAGRLAVKAGRSEFKIVGLDPVDFPGLPECDLSQGFQLPLPALVQLVQRVMFAVTLDESRFPLSGALFLGSAKSARLVATDGHRLSLAEASCQLKGLKGEIRFIIPKKTLTELKKVAELGGDSVSIVSRDNHIYFGIGDRLLVSRAVEDQFPAFEKVIPRKNDIKVRFARNELEGAVRRVSLLSPDKGGGLKLGFSDAQLRVSSSNPDLGEAWEELACEFAAEPMEIGFNAQYILDFLSVCESEHMLLELKDSVTQGLFRPDPESGEVTHTYVIMPMHL